MTSCCTAGRHQVVIVRLVCPHPLLTGRADLEVFGAERHLTPEELEQIRRDLGAETVTLDCLCLTLGSAPATREDDAVPVPAPPQEDDAGEELAF